MLTDKDIEKLKKVFTTKVDLSRSVKEILEYIDATNQGNREEMKEYVMTLAKEISSVLTNHEGRIDKLEKQTFTQN